MEGAYTSPSLRRDDPTRPLSVPLSASQSAEGELALAENLAVHRDLALQREFVRSLEELAADTSRALGEREELLVVWAAEIERLRAEVAQLSAQVSAAREAGHALAMERDELRATVERIRSNPLIRAATPLMRLARLARGRPVSDSHPTIR